MYYAILHYCITTSSFSVTTKLDQALSLGCEDSNNSNRNFLALQLRCAFLFARNKTLSLGYSLLLWVNMQVKLLGSLGISWPDVAVGVTASRSVAASPTAQWQDKGCSWPVFPGLWTTVGTGRVGERQVRSGVLTFSLSKQVSFKNCTWQLSVNTCNSSSRFLSAVSPLAGYVSGLWGAPVTSVCSLEQASFCCMSQCCK